MAVTRALRTLTATLAVCLGVAVAPGDVGRRLTRFDLEFRPSTRSLRADARDPLDP